MAEHTPWLVMVTLGLGVLLGAVGTIIWRLFELHRDMELIAREIAELSKLQVSMAHALNQITLGLSSIHATMAEHDQFIAFMQYEEDSEYGPH